jgi:hypothetical protein
MEGMMRKRLCVVLSYASWLSALWLFLPLYLYLALVVHVPKVIGCACGITFPFLGIGGGFLLSSVFALWAQGKPLSKKNVNDDMKNMVDF